MLRAVRSLHIRLLWTLSVLSVTPGLALWPQSLEAQPTITIDFAAFGAATEENPDDPDHPDIILFIGQPAVFQMTITNHGEQDQTIMFGGGGGGGFIIENATVSPEEAGECTIGSDQLFVDCPELTIPGTGSGKGSSFHNSIKVIWDMVAQSVSTGGISAFISGAGVSATVGTSVEVREVGATRTLRVFSLPRNVKIFHTRSLEGDISGETDFSRTYAEGVTVRILAPNDIGSGREKRSHYRWEGDFIDQTGGTDLLGPEVTVKMDADKEVSAQYATLSVFGFEDIIKHFLKRQAVVDVYANGILHIDNLAEETITPFLEGPSGATFDITDGAATDNSDPLLSFSFEAEGQAAIILFSETDHVVNHEARTEALDSTQADLALFLPFGPETIEAVRIVHRIGQDVSELFGSDRALQSNGFTQYATVSPGTAVVEVLDRTDGTQLEAFQVDLPEGAALIGLMGVDDQQDFSLRVFDAAGQILETPIVTASEHDVILPSSFALHGNYPNPFNPETVIRFEVPERGRVLLEVLNPLGQVVKTLIDGAMDPGLHSVTFEAGDLPSGTYLYRLEAADFVASRQMVLIK